MVKVRGPLHSTDARGTLADTITYQKSLNQMSAKSCRFKKYSRSALQARDRNWLTWSILKWRDLPVGTKQLWYDFLDFKGLQGYHSYMRTFLGRTHAFIFQYEAPPYYGYCIVGNHYVGQFVVGGEYQEPPT